MSSLARAVPEWRPVFASLPRTPLLVGHHLSTDGGSSSISRPGIRIGSSGSSTSPGLQCDCAPCRSAALPHPPSPLLSDLRDTPGLLAVLAARRYRAAVYQGAPAPIFVMRVEGRKEEGQEQTRSEVWATGVSWSGDGRHIVLGQEDGQVTLMRGDSWDVVWTHCLSGSGWTRVVMTRSGRRVFAAVHGGGRGVVMSVEGGGVEEVGEEAALGIGVAGGGRRVVTGHQNPDRYEIREGVARTIGVDGIPMCVAIVEGGRGMLVEIWNKIIFIRYSDSRWNGC